MASDIVAVFPMQDKTGGLSQTDLGQLTNYLVAKLTSNGFRVVSPAQIRRRLRKQKLASYKACIDTKCQIEIGRELAAQKTVATQILRLGRTCSMAVTLYDLRTSASERAATEKAACAVEALATAIDRLVPRLRQTNAVGKAAPGPAPKAVPLPKNMPSVPIPDPVTSEESDANAPKQGAFVGSTSFWLLVATAVVTIGTTVVLLAVLGSSSADDANPTGGALRQPGGALIRF